MKKIYLVIIAALFVVVSLKGQTIQDFSLKNVDGKMVSLSSYNGKAAVVVIFSSNHCVYSKKYEARIIALAKANQGKNVQFLLINSNDAKLSEEDNMGAMQARAEEKGYPFPYLKDESQSVAKAFGAKKTPQAFVLLPKGGSFSVAYSGVIDDNALMADRVQKKYLEQALSDVLSGGAAQTTSTDPVGCNIKWK